MNDPHLCPNCGCQQNEPEAALHEAPGEVSRRDFVKTAGATAAIAGMSVAASPLQAAPEKKQPQPEQLVEKLYHSLTPQQKPNVCFDWNHTDERGLLRTRVENNWSITDRNKFRVGGSFFDKDQQEMIEAIFFGMYNPEWHDRIRKQLRDDAGGYGKAQTVAIFGEPGAGQFEFVMTGRHLTIRCDGNSSDHVAFGGPIFYGHASKGSPDAFNELPDHPGNVFCLRLNRRTNCSICSTVNSGKRR